MIAARLAILLKPSKNSVLFFSSLILLDYSLHMVLSLHFRLANCEQNMSCDSFRSVILRSQDSLGSVFGEDWIDLRIIVNRTSSVVLHEVNVADLYNVTWDAYDALKIDRNQGGGAINVLETDIADPKFLMCEGAYKKTY